MSTLQMNPAANAATSPSPVDGHPQPDRLPAATSPPVDGRRHPRLEPGRLILYQRRFLLVATRLAANAATALDEYGHKCNLILTPLGWAVLPWEIITTSSEDEIVEKMFHDINLLEREVGNRLADDTRRNLSELEGETRKLQRSVSLSHYAQTTRRLEHVNDLLNRISDLHDLRDETAPDVTYRAPQATQERIAAELEQERLKEERIAAELESIGKEAREAGMPEEWWN
jgi:hypothetical protein